MTNRIILLIAGLGLAWCSLWGGNELSLWAQLALNADRASRAPFVPGVIAVFALIWGIVILVETTKNTFLGDTFSAAAASINLVCFAFLFGVIVTPIGNGVEKWLTPWDFLLILGFLPVTFVAKEIIINSKDALHAKSVFSKREGPRNVA